MLNHRWVSGIAAMVLSAVCACEGTERPETERVQGTVANGERAAPDDADIQTLVAQTNAAEMSAARSAESKLASAEVKAYAARMLSEHRAMDAALDSSGVRTDTLSQPPSQFATMQAASKATAALLQELPPGPAYDRGYMASQVADHQAALDSLKQWQTRVRADGLRSAIAGAIPRVQSHLDQARALRDALGGGIGPGSVPAPGSAPPPASALAPRIPPPSGSAPPP